MWRPSPGSVYPTLQLLEDEGLVHAEERDGTRVYDLTDAGREKAGEPFEEGHRPPWEHAEGDDRYRSLKETVGQLAMAARQVGRPVRPNRLTEPSRSWRGRAASSTSSSPKSEASSRPPARWTPCAPAAPVRALPLE